MQKRFGKNTTITRREFIQSAAAITTSVLVPASRSHANDPLIRNPVRSFSTRNRNDITFYMTADTHYNARWQGIDNEAGNRRVIDRINRMADTIKYPSEFGGGYVQRPRGVVCLGDLTDHAKESDWHGTETRNGWVDDYGLNGVDGRLNYPVYELYGNHDCVFFSGRKTPKEGIRERNRQRQNVNVSSNGYHYSWDWDDVHLINLNICPGGPGAPAEDSLGFARQDITNHVGNSGRPVVVFTHYGWKYDVDKFNEPAFYNMVKDLNIIALFHGHWHNTQYYRWRGFNACCMNSSQRVHKNADWGNGLFEGVGVARITENKLLVAEHDYRQQWTGLFQKDIAFNHLTQT
jgi:Calcineurin-like phosphoesterase